MTMCSYQVIIQGLGHGLLLVCPLRESFAEDTLPAALTLCPVSSVLEDGDH